MNWIELYFKMEVILGIVAISIIVMYILWWIIAGIIETIKDKMKKDRKD